MASRFQIDLKQAQDLIYHDWEAASKLYVEQTGCEK